MQIEFMTDLKWRALVLRLLSQILIKTQTGGRWGASDAGVLELTGEAEEMAKHLAGEAAEREK